MGGVRVGLEVTMRRLVVILRARPPMGFRDSQVIIVRAFIGVWL